MSIEKRVFAGNKHPFGTTDRRLTRIYIVIKITAMFADWRLFL